MPRMRCALVAFALLGSALSAQKPLYDEAGVPAYTLPDPLLGADGERVATVEAWRERRRPELLALFEQHVYGATPAAARAARPRVEVLEDGVPALGGTARRTQVALVFGDGDKAVTLDLLLYTPAAAKAPVPAFLGLNFYGNHSVHADPGIRLARCWLGDNEDLGVVDHRATEAGRGRRARRWPVETILARGYALVTACYNDLDPDVDDGFRNGVHALFDDHGDGARPANAWGAIGAWAWGLSRALDYLETDARVDAARVAVLGHSRLGKTALWAGAQDPRFWLVISNDSGCGGAALSRRRFGETIARITRVFPHWFCDGLDRFADHEDELPVDQHELIALIAPRPVYVASAAEDLWADPRGEFLAALHAGPVFALFGRESLDEGAMPAVGQSVGVTVGYHVRAGKHDLTATDWGHFLRFADRHRR